MNMPLVITAALLLFAACALFGRLSGTSRSGFAVAATIFVSASLDMAPVNAPHPEPSP